MTQERTVKLSLRNSVGKNEEYFFDYVSQSKKLEYIRKEAELERRTDSEGNKIMPTAIEYDELQAEFVAGLFSDKKVTKKTILDGLDSQEFKKIYEIVRYRVLGFSKDEDERAKKLLMENLQHGQNSTISKSDLPEK